MSMLAEPRSRQKWSDDPRNTRWASDKTKFGYQMLTKMGWSEGKGLGQKESGGLSHIKVKKRKSNAGIGVQNSHDDDWIAHQNDFNALLSQLNQGLNKGAEKKITSLEARVKLSQKKILYTKFVKSKDLSNASSHDLACIFGQRSKSAPAAPQRNGNEDNDSDASIASCPVNDDCKITENEHGITTVNTGISVADYFAKKMAALKQAQVINSSTETNIGPTNCKNEQTKNTEEEQTEDVKIQKKKRKKKKKDEGEEDEIDQENKTTSDDPVKLKKKKSSKAFDSIEGENEIQELYVERKKQNRKVDSRNDEQEENTISVKKKRSKSKNHDNEQVIDNCGEVCIKRTKGKKKKKSKIENRNEGVESIDIAEYEKSVKKKRKKKKTNCFNDE